MRGSGLGRTLTLFRSQAQLDAAVAATARNPQTVAPIAFSPSDPPTQAEFQAVIDKFNELIAALTRV